MDGETIASWLRNLSLELQMVEDKEFLEPQQAMGPHDRRVGVHKPGSIPQLALPGFDNFSL